MRKGLIFGLLMLMSCPVFAQLTVGEPMAKKIRTGNRAEEGDFGIYIGATSNMFKAMFKDKQDFEIQPIPLVNLKYMVTDQFEARIGLEFSKKKEVVKGDMITDSSYDENDNLTTSTVEVKNKVVDTDNRIIPGFAYHFSRSNLLDVYAGAELPIGWKRYSVTGENDGYYTNTTKSAFQIGLGAFIGLQVHIADLPLALGVEYGISSMFDGRLRIKNVSKEDGGSKETAYAPDVDSFPMLKDRLTNDVYDSLKARKGEIGNQFRVTLTYYFK